MTFPHLHLYFCSLKDCPFCAALRSVGFANADTDGDAESEKRDKPIQPDSAILKDVQVTGMVN